MKNNSIFGTALLLALMSNTSLADEINLNTQYNDDGDGNAIYLDRHDVNCAAQNKALRSFKLQRDSSGQNIRYDYTCSGLPNNTTLNLNSTAFNDDGRGNVLYLDRHSVDCGNQPLSQFWLRRSSNGTQIKYDYTCANLESLYPNNIETKYTVFNDDGDGNSLYLDRHNLQCDQSSLLTSFRLQRNGQGNQIRYQYTCAQFPSTLFNNDNGPYLTNLVRNGDASEGFKHWIRTYEGGDGWRVLNNVGEYSGFQGSYEWSYMGQTIDLVERGFKPEILDTSPYIHFSSIIQQAWCQDEYMIRLDLIGENRSTLKTIEYNGKTDHECSYEGNYDSIDRIIGDYGKGLRSIRITLASKDGELWAGNFGAVIKTVNLTLLPTNLLNSPQTKQSWTYASGENGITVLNSGLTTQFETSDGWTSRAQVIDLYAKGFSQDYISKAPHITVLSEFGYVNCTEEFSVDVDLLDKNMNILANWRKDISEYKEGCDGSKKYMRLTHTFENYSPSVRFVRLNEQGRYGSLLTTPYIGLMPTDAAGRRSAQPLCFGFCIAAFVGLTAAAYELTFGTSSGSSSTHEYVPPKPKKNITPSCPNQNINFVIFSVLSGDGTKQPKDHLNSTAKQMVKQIKKLASNNGYDPHVVDGRNATKKNFLDLLACENLKGFQLIAHGNGMGTGAVFHDDSFSFKSLSNYFDHERQARVDQSGLVMSMYVCKGGANPMGLYNYAKTKFLLANTKRIACEAPAAGVFDDDATASIGFWEDLLRRKTTLGQAFRSNFIDNALSDFNKGWFLMDKADREVQKNESLENSTFMSQTAEQYSF